MKIRYPSLLDMHDQFVILSVIINKITGVSIVEITHNLIIISDTNEKKALSRFMRKNVCRLQLNEVSRQ